MLLGVRNGRYRVLFYGAPRRAQAENVTKGVLRPEDRLRSCANESAYRTATYTSTPFGP
jgi:hypothetical protein